MKYAYVTLLSTDDYIIGVLGLKHSLDRVNCQYPFIVIVTQDISTDTIKILENNNIQYKIVNTIYFPETPGKNPKRYTTCANKLYLYTFTEYQKVMFIDADCIITFNIDFMFDYPTPVFYASNIYTEEYPAGDLWGGLFIIEPNEDLFKKFMVRYKFFFTDEQLLNSYYQKKEIYVYRYYYFVIHEPFEKKYWQRYNLKDENEVKNFIDYSLYKLM